MKNTTECNISFPKDMFDFIEQVRGDVPRSRYVVKALEKSLQRAGYRATGATISLSAFKKATRGGTK